MKIIIETERLLLREITLNDKEVMLKLHGDPQVQKYTGDPLIDSIEQMEKVIKTRIKNYEKYGYGRWATFLKNELQFIGWAGLAYLPEFNETDLGYRFLPKYWGKGFATEASRAILTYGFEQLLLSRIIGISMKENKASINILEKVGMQFEKLSPYEPGGEDVVWYTCNNNQMKKS